MIKDSDRRFNHLEKKIGIFAVVALAGFLAMFFYIGVDNDLFTKKYSLKFTVKKGTGFSRGMPVKLSGFRIGRIDSISLNELAMVDIKIKVGKEYQKWIKKDSIAKLVKEGLVGDSIIEISVGSPKVEALKDGEVIVFEPTKGLEEVANDLADKVRPVLIEVRDIISYVNDPRGDIKQTMKNLKELTAELHSTRKKVDALLTDSNLKVGHLSAEAENLMKNADNRLNSISPVLEKADRSIAVVEQKLPQLLDKAQITMDHLDKASQNIEIISEQAKPRIPLLMNNAEGTLKRADTVLDAVMDIWPFKNHKPSSVEKESVNTDSKD